MIKLLSIINLFLSDHKEGVDRHTLIDFLFDVNEFIENTIHQSFTLVLLDHGSVGGYVIHFTNKQGEVIEIPVNGYIKYEDDGDMLGLKSIIVKMSIAMITDEGDSPISMFSEEEVFTYLEERYKPYYEKNDEAHQLNHINSNIENTCRICHELDVVYNPYITTLTSFAHDMYSSTKRKLHHQEASRHVLNKEDIIYHFLLNSELEEVANACNEHRASYKGEYSSLFSEIYSVADRGDITVEDILTRTFQASLKRGAVFKELDIHAEDQYSIEDVAYVKTFLHVKNKWGKRGYVKSGVVFDKVHNSKIEEVSAFFSKATPNDIYNKLIEFGLI